MAGRPSIRRLSVAASPKQGRWPPAPHEAVPDRDKPRPCDAPPSEAARRKRPGRSRAGVLACSAGPESPPCSGLARAPPDDHGRTTRDAMRFPCASPAAATRHTGQPRRGSLANRRPARTGVPGAPGSTRMIPLGWGRPPDGSQPWTSIRPVMLRSCPGARPGIPLEHATRDPSARLVGRPPPSSSGLTDVAVGAPAGHVQRAHATAGTVD